MTDIMVIGIAGGTGSGKTTLLKALVNRFGDDIAVISHDNYYKAHDDMPMEDRAKLNYDEPNAFDTDMLVEHVRLLKRGLTIHCPIYDFTVHNRTKETIEVTPKPVIVVEGILIFADKDLCNEMDIRIFVDTDADVRLARRIKRDVKKRGRSLESVLEQYLSTVKPMHEMYVEPSRRNADLVIPEGGKNMVAQEMIMGRIDRHISDYAKRAENK